MASAMKRIGMSYCHSVFQKFLTRPLGFSWEPTENFLDCERLLNSFWAEAGEYKKEKAREGIVVIPRKQWIGTYSS
jgi:hypothetical protein